jgi:hypothetical protein
MPYVLSLPLVLAIMAVHAEGQTSVLTAHNDIARTGQNLNETILTPANIDPSLFGRLFTQTVDDKVFAQPLFVPNVTIPGKGVHNVVYVATEGNSVYAFDADSNAGANAKALWHVLLLGTTPLGTESLRKNIGIVGTPVIDPSTSTMYVATFAYEGTTYLFRLHALDITQGTEKFGGPVQIQASVPGTGNGSSGGVLTFDPEWQVQRPGLLLLNGVLYVAFASFEDVGSWHGWIFSYNAATLQQIDVFNGSANGYGAGIWMSGAGLSAEVTSGKPYGRMFVPTGNGTFAASAPYTNSMSYGMTIMNLDLTGGKMTVQDTFTPFNWSTLDKSDGDLGSGGALILPQQTTTAGKTYSPLFQAGKSGMLYLLDRNNLGGFNATTDQVVQEIQTPQSGANNWGAGIWAAPTYWNNTIYYGGSVSGSTNSLTAYSFLNGRLSATPTSQTTQLFGYPGPTVSISANGNKDAIAWVLETDGYPSNPAVLWAYDATNLSKVLYSSTTNTTRDALPKAVKFAVATVANGKVYVGTQGGLSVFGLLGNDPTVAPPVFAPPSQSFTNPISVSITDATSGASIYYTTDSSTPTTSSTLYTGAITVSNTETITAIASAPGYLTGAPVAATYTSLSNTATPIFSLAGGTYSGTQSLTMSDATSGAAIRYTVDGSTPTASSTLYSAPLTISTSQTVKAIAIKSGLSNSAVVSASYVIVPNLTIDFSGGFTTAQGPMQFNGSTGLDDFRLQLTNGGLFETSSAYYATPVNIQSFTTDFTFQLSNAAGDGFTFAIQNQGVTALGGGGSGLGYSGITKSAAIKFDLYNNSGEGPDSTGLYTNGATPTTPSIDLSNTGIDLHSGDPMAVHMTYDGTNLTVSITDTVTGVTWSKYFTINIPSLVGGNTAFVGFTAGSGSHSASQKIMSWTYLSGAPAPPQFTPSFTPVGLILNGSKISGTSLQLTDGGTNEARSAYYGSSVNVQAFISDFDFQLLNAVADGFTFVIQHQGLNAVGSGLGYGLTPANTGAFINKSVAVKFDVHNNSGEGVDSTGLYLNGASPTIPSTDLTSTGLQLNSGDVIHSHIVYDGLNLTMTLTDASKSKTATVVYPVNIPSVVGGNTAYIGFTGATGNSTSTQNILNWTFALATPMTATPVITPVTGTYSGAQTVKISDATSGASIYYTTDGSIPTTASKLYSGSITVNSSQTIKAIAKASGTLASAVATAAFTITSPVADAPVISPGSGTYSAIQSVTITDTTAGAKIYYSTDGSTPTIASNLYIGPITVNVTETIRAIAVATGYTSSSISAATFTITTPYPSYGSGFTASSLSLNSVAKVSGGALQLTDGNLYETTSAYYTNLVNVQSFTTDFTFQQLNAAGDGFTFTIGNHGLGSIGGGGAGLGYSGITSSIAIKFDLYNNAGEGVNSTGLYTNGAMPTTPSINLANTGIDLHSGDLMAVHLTYDGKNLTLSITDTVTLASWSTYFAVDIPTIVGANTAYVGFTAASGAHTANQKIMSWTYLSGPPAPPNYATGIVGAGLILNGPKVKSSFLQLTDGGLNEARSAYFGSAVNVQAFKTDFDFEILAGVADGFTFVIQNQGLNAVGSGLGYGLTPANTGTGITKSVAVKFDIHNNSGEGVDSTGLYVNGASPTIPATDLTSSGVQLNSGDQIHAHIVYDGTNVTLTLTDASKNATSTSVFPVNIPAIVGGNTAYVGFTAGTGNSSSTQNILTWTYGGH